MSKFKIPFLRNKQKIQNIEISNNGSDQFVEIGKLVKQARIQKNISIEDLSRTTKIPEQTINSIENNIEKIRPKYPFIRSILSKLEDSLLLKKNTLVHLLINDTKKSGNIKKKYLVSKFDLLNNWIGTFLYFLVMIVILFSLKKFFYSNTDVIEIQNLEDQIIGD